MIVGNERDYTSFGEANPNGFYRVKSSETWSFDPYIMTRTELDEEIKKGIKLYEKYFPNDTDWGQFLATAAVIAVGAAAVAYAGTAVAAQGAGQAAAQGAAASSAASNSAVSSALAVGTGSSPAIAAGGSQAASLGSQAFSIAKSAAPMARKVGGIAKAVGGGSEADALIKTASILENSSKATDVASKVFENELKKRGMEIENERARKAMRERVKKEKQSYAAWLRREAAKRQDRNPDVKTSGQQSMLKWLPIATPFILIALSNS